MRTISHKVHYKNVGNFAEGSTLESTLTFFPTYFMAAKKKAKKTKKTKKTKSKSKKKRK